MLHPPHPARVEVWQQRRGRDLDEPLQGPCKVSPFQHLHGIGKGSPWILSCLQNALPDPCLLPQPPFLHPQVYTRYGKCYTFNGDRRNPRVTRQGGMGNGLEIMLDIQQEEYLPIWRETSE